MKQPQNPFEEYWLVEASLANLPNHLIVANHTHRSRHGIAKHWQSLCLTEGGWHSSTKQNHWGRGGKITKGIWSQEGEEKE
jgi:hypothetical protein